MQVRVFRVVVIASATAALAVAACNLGDSDYSSSSSGGRGGLPPVGSGFDGGAPTESSPCESLTSVDYCQGRPYVCEEGDHANAACNTILRCNPSDRLWELDPEAGACATSCPTEFVPDAPDACAVPHAGTLICSYNEGTCGCAPVYGDGGLDAGKDAANEDDPVADAGDAGKDGGRPKPSAYVWTCIKAQPGCPRARPPLGSRCVQPMRCDYGKCVFEDGLAVRCDGDYWTDEPYLDDPYSDAGCQR